MSRRKPTKPCATCGHGKGMHRVGCCRHHVPRLLARPPERSWRVRPMTHRKFFARILAALGFGPKCEHAWRTVGYGGAGWYLLRCDKCGAEEIG